MSGSLTSTSGPTRQTPEPMGRGSVVLLYHRVACLPFDPQWLAVTPDHFAEHLDVLSRVAHPMSLRDMTRRLNEGTSMDGGVVLTFDDGYADNLIEALPLLDRFAMPATLFVASGYVGGDREYWWDELERLLFSPVDLPPELQLDTNAKHIRPIERRASGSPDHGRSTFRLGAKERPALPSIATADSVMHPLDTDTETLHVDLDETRHTPLADFSRWNVTASHDPTCRHRLYRTLFDILRPMDHGQRDAVLTALAAWSGESRTVRDSHRPMSREELSAWNRHPLVEIGAHTVTHPVLSLMDAQQQAQEIVQSKRELEETIGEPVSSFSYPFGTRRDYSEATVQAVRDAGFDQACSNYSGMVTPTAKRFQLPRALVRDGDGDSLARQLTEMGVGV